MSCRKKPARRRKKIVWPWLAIVIAAGAASLWIWQSRSKAPSLAANTPFGQTAAAHKIESDSVTFAKYAGSQSCRECHEPAFADWINSHHALAERLIDSTLDSSAFEPPHSFKHGSQTSEAHLSAGRFEILTLGGGHERKAFPVERVLGVNPLRQFLVSAPGGRFQVTEVAFDPGRADWFDIFGDENRQPGEWGHWTGRGMNWNSMCAACHNTRLRKNYREQNDAYATAMAERGVGCEAENILKLETGQPFLQGTSL